MVISLKSAALAALSFLSFSNATPMRVNWQRDASKTDATPDVAYKNVVYLANRCLDPNGRNFQLSDLPVSQISHIIYAFANVSSTGEVTLSNPYIDTQRRHDTSDSSTDTTTTLHGALSELFALKKSNRHLKTLLSLGGPSCNSSFTTFITNPSARHLFVTSALHLLTTLGLDGLDIDWEFPPSTTHGTAYLLLLRELRSALDTYSASHPNPATNQPYHHLLTIASPTNPTDISHLGCLRSLARTIDWFNLMTYDFSGRWSPVSSHQSNLFSPSPSSQPPSSQPPSPSPQTKTPTGQKSPRRHQKSTQNAVNIYLTAGVPPSKLLLGMPIYGRSFRNTAGLGSPFSSSGEYTYNSLPVPIQYDPTAGATYTYDPNKRELISFDTPGMVERKVRWLREKRLGGAMFWEVSMDRKGEGSLVGAGFRALGGAGAGAGGLERGENQVWYPESGWVNVRM
ncbi:glycoside hydrolase [Podospora aff. communis PSN243]|uniref:chitinase n=1 Tax=Podospora aff. communis PSN243 TaxID=3040156 RepID=A0AAV9GB03_9PEZI|nr:glycoside hydrolase [Podospora aff. communis PSN243]